MGICGKALQLRKRKNEEKNQEKRRRENHRRKYYIAITPSTETQRNSDHDKEKGQSEPEIPHLLRNCVEDNANDAIFIPGVRITLNPTSYGNCQFDALACQLNSLGLFRTGDQLRHSAILHFGKIEICTLISSEMIITLTCI